MSMEGTCNWAQPGRIKRFLRFVKREKPPTEEFPTLWSRLHSDDLPLEVNQKQGGLVLKNMPTLCVPKSNGVKHE